MLGSVSPVALQPALCPQPKDQLSVEITLQFLGMQFFNERRLYSMKGFVWIFFLQTQE